MVNLITIKDLAKRLDKPESTVRTWKRNGVIPESCFFKIGGTVFIKENKLNEWVENS